MTTQADILAAVEIALNPTGIGSFVIGDSPVGGWPTVAQARVFMPRDWPVQETELPIIKIYPSGENKEAQGKAGIQFETSVSVEVIGEVSRKSKPDDASAGLVLTALGQFQREIELAIIGNPVLFGGSRPGLIEQLRSVQTRMLTKADGAVHRGEVSMTFEFVFYQGTEDFQVPVITPIERFHFYVDLINVADPAGTYIPPIPYVPTPAPRTEGPDGRIEAEFEFVPEA